MDQKLFFENKDDHAGEMETSVMLCIQPGLVLPLAEAGDGASRKFSIPALREGWAWAERQWSKVTADTGVGNPSKASAEKGERYLSAVTEKVGQFFYDVATTTRENRYQ